MPRAPIRFIPDAHQLDRGIEHSCYEYTNLISAAHWDMEGDAPWRRHADDAFMLGCRRLGDFLLNSRRSVFRGRELPDILASDYLPPGCTPTWSLPIWTREWRDAMNRQLAHLSYDRDKTWIHYNWVPKLEREFRKAWDEFRKAVDPRHEARFVNEIEKCRGKQGFEAISL